ncbi:hypothetical protein AK812_SmicGene2478 [Symbiodinium microadriaticum]|uniref:Uncharacterized protein n=2 Tax=Symbiodinium TaxID=2949 RepID=A0A1Q9F1C0_SYMMI|nr:hypothetical protein AK812_SmicGene2478 [Symbiodinium microadriaticum]
MYLSDEKIAALLPAVAQIPEVISAYEAFAKIWAACGLPERELSADLVGAVFLEGPSPPILSEPKRLRASDTSLFQLVFLGADGCLDIESFEKLEDAKATLAELNVAATNEGGGVVLKGGEVVAEKLELKYMLKEDFVEFLPEATKEPKVVTVSEEDELKAIELAARENLDRLMTLAPEIGKLKAHYAEKGLEKPEIVIGRPSEALQVFSELFPEYVRLGGCVAEA